MVVVLQEVKRACDWFHSNNVLREKDPETESEICSDDGTESSKPPSAVLGRQIKI